MALVGEGECGAYVTSWLDVRVLRIDIRGLTQVVSAVCIVVCSVVLSVLACSLWGIVLTVA